VADPKDSNVATLPVPEAAHGTLIIAPLSLLSNWTSQITEHLHPETLATLVFHGQNKSANLNLSEYDVVITSYGTLVSEYKKEGLDGNIEKKARKTKQGLFGRTWRRVVLDEAHTIRNPRAKVSLAAARLESVSRWSLTGILI